MRSSTATTMSSFASTNTDGESSGKQSNRSSTSSSSNSNAVHEDESAAPEWHRKEEVYQNELAQLREAILQLEIDRQQAIQK